MFDAMQWLEDCEQALADADSLAARLARTTDGDTRGSIAALRVRIAELRAEFERARITMGLPRLAGGGLIVDGSAAVPWPTTPPPQ